MKIAFFGLPLAALLLNEDGHDVVYAGICRRSAIGTRRLSKKIPGHVDVTPNLGDPKIVDRVREAKPDLLVSWFWTKRIPKSLLDLAPLGAIGVHPSLLPRHRGPDPYFWAIDSGDEETGVTAHRLDEAYDTGEILGQTIMRVDPSWSAWTLAKKLDRPSLALLRQMADDFASGKIPKGVRQDETRATEAPSPSDDDLAISFRWPAKKIERRVRAASPWPGAFFELGSEQLTVVRAEVTRDFPRALAPGEAAVVNGRLLVRAADDAIVILAARVESPFDETSSDQELDAAAVANRIRTFVEVEKKQI